MGVVVAGRVGYFLIQHEVLTAIFFGFPPTVVFVSSLWLTRNLFTEEP